jgi:hypothetical protein
MSSVPQPLRVLGMAPRRIWTLAVASMSLCGSIRAVAAESAPACVRTVCHEVNCTEGMLLGCTCYATATEASAALQSTQQSGTRNSVGLVSRCDGQASTVGRVCCLVSKAASGGETCSCSLVYQGNDCSVLEQAGFGRLTSSCAGGNRAAAANGVAPRGPANPAAPQGPRRNTRVGACPANVHGTNASPARGSAPGGDNLV